MKTLLDPEVLNVLDELTPGADPLALRKRLAGLFPPDLAREISEQNSLRERARGKFARLAGILLTAKGLEQATPLEVARRRAGRISKLLEIQAERGPILDATAGLGADTIALSAANLPSMAAEIDGRTVRYLAQNLRAHRCRTPVVQARLQDWAIRAPLLLADPDRRRPDGRRVGHPEAWSPPLSAVLRVAGNSQGAVIKLAPAMEVADLERHSQELGPTSMEWVSWKGELKEVTLWMGCLAGSDSPGQRRAVALSNGAQEEVFGAGSEDLALSCAPLSSSDARSIQWISEPGAAVLRAGLLGAMAVRTNSNPVGPEIAYLGSEERLCSPCLTSFRVLGTAKADPKRVKALLAEHSIGPLTVKRRGHPLDAEQLARRFRGPGKKHGLLIVARLEEGHQAWLVERDHPLGSQG